MLRSELLEREAEARRLELAETFDELRARATPGHMLDRLVDYASDSGGVDFLRNLRDQSVANPLALGLVGAGLAWLMLSGRDSGGWRGSGYDPYAYEEVPRSRGRMRSYVAATQERAGNAMSGTMSGARHMMRGAGHVMSDAGHFAGHVVSDTAAGVRDRISGAARGVSGAAQGVSGAAQGVAHLASDTAGSIASRARGAFGAASSIGEHARERAGDTSAAIGGAASAFYDEVAHSAGRTAAGMRAVASGTAATSRDALDFARDQPLVLAGLGLAFGAAMGAMFPATEAERELMGEAIDGLKERARGTQAFAAAEALYGGFQGGSQQEDPQGQRQDPEGRSASAAVANTRSGQSHTTSLVPIEEITEIQETIRPERIGLHNERD
jgi:hypothetical protein